jgi:hypothetical protein
VIPSTTIATGWGEIKRLGDTGEDLLGVSDVGVEVSRRALSNEDADCLDGWLRQ